MQTADFPADEHQRLLALWSCDLLDTDPEPSFDEIVELAAATAETPIALITLVDSDRQWFKARQGLDADQTSRDVAFCAHAILSQDPFIVENALLDERFDDNPLVVGDPHIRFYAGFPLTERNGHRLGTLCVIDRVPRTLAGPQRRQLQMLAMQASLDIQRRQVDLRGTRSTPAPPRSAPPTPSSPASPTSVGSESDPVGPPKTHDSIHQRILALRPLPDVVLRLAAAVADEGTEISDVVSIVESDPVLIGSVIRQANSATSAPVNEITTVRESVVRLGLAVTLAAATTGAIGDRHQLALPAYRLKPGQLWDHAVMTAAITEQVRKRAKLELDPGVVTAALLHHLGQPILDAFLNRKTFVQLLDHDLAIESAELEIVELDHAEVGGLLLDEWKLPQSIADAVRFHHVPELNSSPESYAILAASHLATTADAEPADQPEAVSDALQTLGIGPDSTADLLPR